MGRQFPLQLQLSAAAADHDSAQSFQPRETGAELNGGGGAEPAHSDSDSWFTKYQRGVAETVQQLRVFGVAGMLAYGLLNSVYYSLAFLCVWIFVSPAPSGLGYRAAIERFFQVLAVVWAGSQVTKLFRAGGALLLAPLVDKGLSMLTAKLGLKSRGQAFALVASGCVGTALLLFLVVVTLSA